MKNTSQRPMYLHGLEGSPQGTKGAWMTRTFGAYAPTMPAKAGDEEAFEKSYRVALEAVQTHRPNLIVGSSFGGAILMRLILERHWKGPSIFLAQAGVRYGLGDRLPSHIHAILIHGRQDTLIPIEDSILLAHNSGQNTILWGVDGEHRLHHIVEDGTLKKAVEHFLSP